ncbi:hypothetical protein J6TS2_50760 [Heyndrickxia sporothermodurans]|nr:hypothetical protein J6TS2_50760 [Heyndrickxia sporothermodurans]
MGISQQEKICKIDGCKGKYKGLGYCTKHYQRFKKHGDPLKNNRRKKLITFDIDENGCFNCTSHAECNGGYHRMRVGKDKHILIHRFIYEQCYGMIPNDLIVRHKCDNPHCINPEHLELGTYQDNMMDKVNRGRCNSPYGERVKQSKLKENDVKEIRYLLTKNLGISEIARKYGVSPASISRIKDGISWVKVKGIKVPEEN